MILPNGSKPIIAARAKGKKPAEMVIVSLIGPTGDRNHTIYANPSASYEWEWVVRLKVCIYANQNTNWRNTAMAIARKRPEWLGLWDVDAFEGCDVHAWPLVDDIEKLPSEWRYKLHFFPWLPFQNFAFAWGD